MSAQRVIIIGAGFAGLAAARDLKGKFRVTVIDAKEYFEYTPGILRAYVRPSHLDALTFALTPVLVQRMGLEFIWGEVMNLDGLQRRCVVKPKCGGQEEVLKFAYCIIASGCNFGVFSKWGESLWFPTIHDAAQPEGAWPHLDERYLEGRRRHIAEEHQLIQGLNDKSGTVLVVGAGFIGVEWVTELQHFFPGLRLSIVDALPQCLGPLPQKASAYCSRYMTKRGIREHYNLKYNPKDPSFYASIRLGHAPDKEYVCVGVKASNYFMPKETLSERGPGGGGWILMDMTLAVKKRDGEVWSKDEHGFGRVFAIGDCNYGCVDGVGKPDEWPIPPIPKISYPGEEEALIVSRNIGIIDQIVRQGAKTGRCGRPLRPYTMHWPWGAGMFATSLGPRDACFVIGADWRKNSGMLVSWGFLCSVQKDLIERTKVNECAYGILGRLIWHLVHHTPVHLWGGGPRFGYRERPF